MAIYFISDFHLGVPNLDDSHQRELKLLRFLNGIQSDCEELFLMGDLFDFWFEYKTVIPRGFARLQGKLAEFTDAGIPVHLFIGNHDLWSFGYLRDELGIQLHREPEIITRHGKKFFLVHGDGRGPGDKGYKFLKKVFECRFNQFLFRWLHPDLGIGLALRWSHKHRLKKLRNEVEKGYYNEVEKTRLYQYALSLSKQDPSIDFFVFGHQHKGMQYASGDHALTTVVGNWIRDFNYAIFDGETVTLKTFES
ncbi:MAG: UDP-2,3-diacylglucosamine diphosphatase [Bacteroidales bacterium]|nr:UDP-2,3-diacylglucosamine diphosphatase [Bacteroidales bacterium]